MTKLQGLIDELKTVKAKFVNEGKTAVHEALQEVFAQHPKLEQLSWTQYTPYFNDGETCYFSVNEIEDFTFDGAQTNGYGSYDWDAKAYKRVIKPGQEEMFACLTALNKLSDQLQKATDVLEAVFGDHVQVTVTRGGILVDEYEHD